MRSTARVARRLERDGRLSEAIHAWTAVNHRRARASIEQHLVDLRCDAFVPLDDGASAGEQVRAADPFPDVRDRLPEIHAHELSAPLLAGAIAHHGSLLVRGLFSTDGARMLVDTVDRAFDARERFLDGAPVSETSPWYAPCARWTETAPRAADAARRWSRECDAVQAADSPRALFEVLDALEAAAIPDVVSGCLGGPAVLSVNKTTIRRVPADAFPAWHQDGAFMGSEVRAVDVWVALSECGDGTDAPGISVLARRLDDIVPHGTPGAFHKDSVSRHEVAKLSEHTPVVTPTFAPGDALLFDEMCLHATAGRQAGLSRARYALEAWLFAPASFPAEYVPMVV